MWMPYSATDLAAIEKAIIDLAAGARVVEVTHGGRRVAYQQADLEKLRELRREAQRESAAGRTGHVVVSTSKGL
jgi:gpW